MGVTIFFFLATVILATNAQAARPSVPFQSHLLQPHSGKLRDLSINATCASWRLSVEVNNIRSWSLVPGECLEYITDYILGGQYIADCFTVVDVAYAYAKSLTPSQDGKDIWVFDMDETALSEIDYYSQPDVAFGTKAFNETKKNEYLMVARSPPLIPVYLLYAGLLDKGFKIVFISGTSETYRDYRIANLKYAGYIEWEKVLLKSTSEHGITSLVYKSKKRDELVAEGYRIVGNVGDQWSDLLGSNTGNRTFKIPNPMYYIN